MPSELIYKNIFIRTKLKSGDLGYVIYRHGKIYAEENGYSLSFEAYVAKGLAEFYLNYDEEKDCVWICEDEEKIIGFLVLMHRSETTAQFRFFYLESKYRGIGLGNKLMQLFIETLNRKGYQLAYLWTTHEQERAAKLYQKYGFALMEEKETSDFGKTLIEQRFELSF